MAQMICPRCGDTKDASEFPPSLGIGKISRPRQCLACRKAVDREKGRRYRQANPDRKDRYREYDGRRKERRREKWRTDAEYREKNREAARRYKVRNAAKIRDLTRQRRQAVRLTIIERYGGQCECCGEERVEFLAVDHVHGGGGKERKEIGPHRIIYKLYRAEGRLPGYRLLCHNCNAAIAIYGCCPHQRRKSIFDTATPAVISSFIA